MGQVGLVTADFLAGVEDPCQLLIFSDALDDGGFWDWVHHRILPTDPHPENYDELDPYWDQLPTLKEEGRCPECGEYGACSYDHEGRPVYHLLGDDDAE